MQTRRTPNWPVIVALGITLALAVDYARKLGDIGFPLLPQMLFNFVLYLLVGLAVRAAWRLFWRLTRKPAGGEPAG